MDKLDKEAAELIRKIANPDKNQRFPIMSGIVKSVNTSNRTCEVAFTVDGGDATTEVLLNVKLNSISGFHAVPVVGADCIVAEVDGPGNMWELLKASDYSKMFIKAGSLVQFNAGANGGVPVAANVSNHLNVTENDLNTLRTGLNNLITSISGAGPPTTPVTTGSLAAFLTGALASFLAPLITNTVPGDLENPDVMH